PNFTPTNSPNSLNSYHLTQHDRNNFIFLQSVHYHFSSFSHHSSPFNFIIFRFWKLAVESRVASRPSRDDLRNGRWVSSSQAGTFLVRNCGRWISQGEISDGATRERKRRGWLAMSKRRETSYRGMYRTSGSSGAYYILGFVQQKCGCSIQVYRNAASEQGHFPRRRLCRSRCLDGQRSQFCKTEDNLPLNQSYRGSNNSLVMGHAFSKVDNSLVPMTQSYNKVEENNISIGNMFAGGKVSTISMGGDMACETLGDINAAFFFQVNRV
ncbi:hypothetical protein LINPERPRIM_LOCUS10974, partial [Linum perenne]